MALDLPTPADRLADRPADTSVLQLRERMQRMQDGVPRMPLPTLPAFDGLVQLRTGGSYGVDSAGLAVALLAGPSQAGAWAAVIGAPDLGLEAAAAMGVDLTRTILVPDPGQSWLEVTAAMVDVVSVVLLRPPAQVSEHVAGRLGARLRKRSSVLIAWGEWPRCEATLSLSESVWSGAGQGHGHLHTRRVVVSVSSARRGTAPPTRTPMWLPGADLQVRRCTPEPAPVTARKDAS